MDKRVVLAVSLCAAIYLVWYSIFSSQFKAKQGHQQAQSIAIESNEANQGNASNQSNLTAAPAVVNGIKQAEIKATENVQLGDEKFGFIINTTGGKIERSIIAGPKHTTTTNANIETLIGGPNQLEISSPSQEWNYISNVNYKVVQKDSKQIVLQYEDENLIIERTYEILPSEYLLQHKNKFHFKKTTPQYLFIGLNALKDIPKQENERRTLLYNKTGGQESWTVSDIDSLHENLTEGTWIAFTSRYFLNALINEDKANQPQFQVRPAGNNIISANLIYKINNSLSEIPMKLYYGPKEVDTLKSVGYHLDSAVDFGWFTVFAYPLLQALKWLYKFVHNYGIAIILLTVLVKLLTYPLTYKSMKSMKEMQRIQPQLQKLREKYKDDKEKLNKEMLHLMRSNGYNPMSGCFPMLIQMPIFIALYNVLYGAFDLYGEPFFGWIHDLSAKDPFFVTPILLGLMMFIQQKLTPNTATDPAQQKMLMFMPVFFAFMMLWLPSGLTLYMLVNSVMSILQQVVINRKILHSSSVSAAA